MLDNSDFHRIFATFNTIIIAKHWRRANKNNIIFLLSKQSCLSKQLINSFRCW